MPSATVRSRRACPERPRGARRIVVKAGRRYAREGEVFAFEPRDLRVGRCEEVEIVLENTDEVRHDLMIPGLNPIFALNVVGPDVASARFVTPDEDVTLLLHCHIAGPRQGRHAGQAHRGQGRRAEGDIADGRALERAEVFSGHWRRHCHGAARREVDRQPRSDSRFHGGHGNELSGHVAVAAQRPQGRRQDSVSPSTPPDQPSPPST